MAYLSPLLIVSAPITSLCRRILCAVAVSLITMVLGAAAHAANPTLVPMSTYSSGGAAQFTAVADVNRDGKQDIFASNLNGTITLLIGNGDGTFQAPKTIATVAPGAYPIVTADFNHDGNADLAVLEPARGNVLVYFGKGDGTFAAVKTIAIGNAPLYMLTGDLNGDGNSDLIFSATKGTGLSAVVGFTVLLSAGNGSFHAPVLVVAKNGGAGGVMAIGDVNGDHHMDVLTCNGGGMAEVFLGNGNGTFREQAAFDDGFGNIGESQFLLADFYGNGKLDLVIGNFGFENFGGSVTLLEGAGDGTFSNATFYQAGFYPAWFSAADMNGDGRTDLVVANAYSNSVTVLINHGKGNFTSTPDNYATPVLSGGPGQGPMAIGDFNGDKKPDVAVASALGVDVLLNVGAGVLHAPASVEVGVEPGQIIAADYNGDGHLDLAIQTFGFGGNVGAVNLAVGDGKGNLIPTFNDILPEGSAPYGTIAGGSFNGNGKPGVAAYVQGGQILPAYNDGNASFTLAPVLNLAGQNSPSYLCAGDFNGDGYSDFAVLDGNEVDIYLNKHDGTYSGPTTYKTGLNPVFILARDLNYDGKLDLITANNGSNDVSVLLGKGNGTFGLAKEYAAGFKPNVVTSGDFNRDGKVDLAVGVNSKVAILSGRGDGTFSAPSSYSAPGPVTYLAQVDLRGDGIEDLLTVSSNLLQQVTSGHIYLLSGKGDGSFGSPVAYSAGANPYWIAVGDFNQDGAQDVVVANLFGSPTVVLLLNQRGTRIALKSSASSAPAGQPVTFTVTLAASVAGVGVPTGPVAFKDGTKTIGTEQLSGGKASLTTAALARGTHSITASYRESASFNPHVSGSVTVRVN